MPYVSLNPATNRLVKTFPSMDAHQLATALEHSDVASRAWANTDPQTRADLMTQAGRLLQEHCEEYASLITDEMGKLLSESRSEIGICALTCEFYAAHAAGFLDVEPIKTEASKSYVAYEPLGTLLGIMPWNYPFWQVFRFAVPALMGGNGCVFKPASNIPRCGLAVEALFREAGFPPSLLSVLLIESSEVSDAIASHCIHGVTFTGSEYAGRKIAASAGQHLKKCVLELGGSDAFIVLQDADIEAAASHAINARYSNCGQSCIAAKRIVLVPQIAEEFMEKFVRKVAALQLGDPRDETTRLAPMARLDLREELHRQVMDSIAQGAHPVLGCRPFSGEGAYYEPSILDRVTPKMRAYHEELFGPVAVIIRATDEEDAIRIANDTRFGLGSSIWSRDLKRAEILGKRIQAGCVFINRPVKCDPRIPFGGVKASGFGRELSYHGLREFTNAKAVWVK